MSSPRRPSPKKSALKTSVVAIALVVGVTVAGISPAGAQNPYGDPVPAPAPAPRPPAPAAPRPAPRPVPPRPVPPRPAPAPPRPAPAPPVTPPPAPPAPAANPAPPAASGKPADMKLPPGHPPLNQPLQGRRPPPRRAPRGIQKARAKRPGNPGAKPVGQARRKPKGPKPVLDEHGYCLDIRTGPVRQLGNGPNDDPQLINLFHGWMGAKSEFAKEGAEFFDGPVQHPRSTVEDSWVDRQTAHLKWLLTPYPYRYDNHKANPCDRSNQPIPLLANIVNLGLLLFLMVRFGRKPLESGLKSRRDRIMDEMDRAADIRKRASKRLTHYQDELMHLDEKLEMLREQYRDEGEMERQRLEKDLEEARTRLLADVEFQVAQESKTARTTLSQEALSQALTSAEALVTSEISSADQKRLNDEFLVDLARALSDDGAGQKGDPS